MRQEIAHAAWLLFAERGYEETTVAEIARAAGVSRRSFFRYFSSKEDVVVGTTDALAEDVLAAFARRPRSEPPLVAIQRALRPAIETRLADAAEARAIVSLLRESRTLRRAMLERHARLEERLAAADRRADGSGPAARPDAGAARVPRAGAHGHGVQRLVRPAARRTSAAMIDDLFRRLRAVVSRGRGDARSQGTCATTSQPEGQLANRSPSPCSDSRRIPALARRGGGPAPVGREPALRVQGRSARHRRGAAPPELAAPLGRRAASCSRAYQIQVPATRGLRAGRRSGTRAGWPPTDRPTSPYAGPALESSGRYHWRVRVWDGGGRASAWSAPASWEMGLLRAGRLEGPLDRGRLGRGPEDVAARPRCCAARSR